MLSPHFRPALAALLALGLLALATPGAGQTPDPIKLGRQTAGEGLTAYNAGEFEQAVRLFQKARELYPSGQVLRMLGYSELALEHWASAIEVLEAALGVKVAPLSREDRKDVQEQIAKALEHIGSVTVTTRATLAKLSIDGDAPRTLPLDAPLRLVEGLHTMVVSAPNMLDTSVSTKVEGGKALQVVVEPAPKPVVVEVSPPLSAAKGWAPHVRELGIGLLGGGGVLGVAAIATGIQAARWHALASKDVDLHVQHYGTHCAPGDGSCVWDAYITNSERDLANRLRDITVGLAVPAGVLTAAGVVLWLSRANKPAAQRGGGVSASALPVACAPAGEIGVVCGGVF